MTVGDVNDSILASLGAEGNDYYRLEEDVIPAIRKAISWVYLLVDKTREENKRTNEAFKFLRRNRIYQTSINSDVLYEDDVYTLDAILVMPTCFPNSDSVESEVSVRRDELRYASGGAECSRSTSEQIAIAQKNPFKRGNSFQICAETEELKDFASFTYLDPMYYDVAVEDFIPSNLVKIFPAIPSKLVSMIVVLNHPVLEDVDSEILFPENLSSILTQKTLQFISYQESESYDIMKITEEDVKSIVSLFV